MDIEILKEEYSRKMEKALRRGDFALFDNLRRQYDRLLQTREQVTAKTITDTMSKEDKDKCNRLLRKNPSVGGHCRILRRRFTFTTEKI